MTLSCEDSVVTISCEDSSVVVVSCEDSVVTIPCEDSVVELSSSTVAGLVVVGVFGVDCMMGLTVVGGLLVVVGVFGVGGWAVVGVVGVDTGVRSCNSSTSSSCDDWNISW